MLKKFINWLHGRLNGRSNGRLEQKVTLNFESPRPHLSVHPDVTHVWVTLHIVDKTTEEDDKHTVLLHSAQLDTGVRMILGSVAAGKKGMDETVPPFTGNYRFEQIHPNLVLIPFETPTQYVFIDIEPGFTEEQMIKMGLLSPQFTEPVEIDMAAWGSILSKYDLQ